MPKKIKILDAIPELATAPIFYCSTHGGYYFAEAGKQAFSTEFTVPPNTIIIETTPIQYNCFFVNLLDVIEPLLLDRRRFLKYLDGQPSKENRADGKRIQIKNALSNFIIYLPGATIVNRGLSIGSGRALASDGTSQSERVVFKKMVFTKFFSEKKAPIEILKSTRDQLMTNPFKHFESYETILEKLNADSHGEPRNFRIIIFPVCGEVNEPEKYPAQIKYVESLQQKAKLIWATLQTRTFNAITKNYTQNLPASAAPTSFNESFAGVRKKHPLGHGEFNEEQSSMVDPKEPEGPVRRSEVKKDPKAEAILAHKSLPHNQTQVFKKQVVGGAGGGHVNYALIGNLTKAEINAKLQAGEELYEFINGDPTRLTIMQGGASKKSRRKRKVRAGKKTKKYSIFTK